MIGITGCSVYVPRLECGRPAIVAAALNTIGAGTSEIMKGIIAKEERI
ncbi:MAG TPA: hypothetical protein VK302_00660 [Terriglobales bacterium]|nr:hypothetical protein [Terriglobales bacterium]